MSGLHHREVFKKKRYNPFDPDFHSYHHSHRLWYLKGFWINKSIENIDINLKEILVSFQIASHILAYSNSCINPILYAFLSPPFRAGFRSVLTCVTARSGMTDNNGNRNPTELTPRCVENLNESVLFISFELSMNLTQDGNDKTTGAA